MIEAVDRALERLLERELGKSVELSFAAPAASWAERERKRPLLDVHLFEVREETERRSAGLDLSPPAENGAGRTRRPAPRWFRLSYWLSVWGGDAADEHRVLGQALAALARWDALPADVLEGELERLGLPVTMAVALPPAGDAHVATVWSSLGVPLRAALELAVVAPLDVPAAVDAGPPVIERRVRYGRPRPPAPPGKQIPPGMPGSITPPMPRPPAPATPAAPAAAAAAGAKAADEAAPAKAGDAKPADAKAAAKAGDAKPAGAKPAAPAAPEPPAKPAEPPHPPPIEELVHPPDPDAPPRVVEPDAGTKDK